MENPFKRNFDLQHVKWQEIQEQKAPVKRYEQLPRIIGSSSCLKKPGSNNVTEQRKMSERKRHSESGHMSTEVIN